MKLFLRQEHKQTETFRRLNGMQRLRESALILALLSAVFILVSLFSYDPSDPSWSQTSWNGLVENAAGSAGAWFADTLFFVLGILAYPVPFLLLLGGWVFFRRRGDSETLNYTITATKILGIVLIFLTSAGLADLNFDDFGYFSSGGVVGDVLITLSMPIFNLLGTTLVFVFLWAAGLTLFTGISWLTIVEVIGEKTLYAITKVVNLIRGEQDHTVGGAIDISTFDEFDALFSPADPRQKKNHPTDIQALAKGQYAPRKTDYDHEKPIIHSSPSPQLERQIPFSGALAAGAAGSHFAARDSATAPPISNELDGGLDEDIAELTPIIAQRAAPEIIEPKPERVFKNVYKKLPPQPQPIIAPSPPIAPVAPVAPVAPINPSPAPINTTISIEDDLLLPVEIDDDFLLGDDIVIGNQDGLSELERAEADAMFSDDDNEPEEIAPEAENPFLETIREAQKKAASTVHPFLIRDEPNLPKPTEPLPTLDLLDPPYNTATRASDEELQHLAHLIETRLEDYKINVKVKGIFPGPVITRFELELAPGVKVSRIMGLSKDIARSLSTTAVRVVDVIPGKPYVGLELPNTSRETVFMSEVVGSERFQSAKSPLSVVLGKDIAGEAIVTDLGKSPHMLVAGTTGSGKSVGVNVMIISILYKASPEDVRFIMIDPKMLELSVYEGIPHLLTEVVTDMKDASNALRWCVAEMERRYKIMSALGVRNIQGYNDKIKEANGAFNPIPDPFWTAGDTMDETAPMLEKLPFIVVIVDEFADLMMVVGKKVEELIARLAQKARAAGIHLVLATQRPSVDVITGLIKANIPTRMAFTVSNKIDSRTILDQAGAESLLGMGDMLFMPNGSNHPIRVHGAFVNDDEVHRVVSNWKARGKPQYITDITQGDQGSDGLLPGEGPTNGDGEELDPLFDQVVEFVTDSRRASVSGVQRRFKIGYNRAARIVEQLEVQGIVSAPGHNSNREVLAPPPRKD